MCVLDWSPASWCSVQGPAWNPSFDVGGSCCGSMTLPVSADARTGKAKRVPKHTTNKVSKRFVIKILLVLLTRTPPCERPLPSRERHYRSMRVFQVTTWYYNLGNPYILL